MGARRTTRVASGRPRSADAAGAPPSTIAEYFVGTPSRGHTTEAVTDALREAILDGVLPPSAWLREDELASTFNVSRTPVREALRRLSDEGLAVKTAHHGTVVAPMSLEDILALYVVRADLEGLATRLATARFPSGMVERLDAVHGQMRTLARGADPSGLAQLNLDFHRVIREAAGNPYLERFLTQVEHAVRRVPTTFSQPGRPAAVLEEHEAIIRAVRARDGETAERVAKEHMHRAREVRLSILLGSWPGQQPPTAFSPG